MAKFRQNFATLTLFRHKNTYFIQRIQYFASFFYTTLRLKHIEKYQNTSF